MPSTDKHREQYLHNKKLLTDDVFNDEGKFTDWYITIIFYSAVHLVEQEIAKHNIDPGSHETRFKWMNRNTSLRTVSNEYNILYWESRRARYDCVKFTKKDIESIKSNLEKIEALLATAS